VDVDIEFRKQVNQGRDLANRIEQRRVHWMAPVDAVRRPMRTFSAHGVKGVEAGILHWRRRSVTAERRETLGEAAHVAITEGQIGAV
jgi:hypothetical protein